MQDLKGKVAVVTGAANGIGFAMTKRALEEGMSVVLAGVREQTLEVAREQLLPISDRVLIAPTDVAKAEEVAALADKAFAHFGGVHLLVNNAGVGGGGLLKDTTLADWEWVMGVNLWGVIHGIRSFVPRMIQQGEPCHVVNTASVSGLMSYPGSGIYAASKHAVVAISEVLHLEMQMIGAQVGVSALCPGWVRTQIMESARNRPQALWNPPATKPPSKEQLAAYERFKTAIENGMPPEEVAAQTFAAIRDGRFYILTHPEHDEQIRARVEHMLAGRNPERVAPEQR